MNDRRPDDDLSAAEGCIVAVIASLALIILGFLLGSIVL